MTPVVLEAKSQSFLPSVTEPTSSPQSQLKNASNAHLSHNLLTMYERPVDNNTLLNINDKERSLVNENVEHYHENHVRPTDSPHSSAIATSGDLSKEKSNIENIELNQSGMIMSSVYGQAEII